MDASNRVSFIGIVDFTENARWVFATASCYDLLGYEPHELIGMPSLDLVHPDEFAQVKKLHYDTIRQDKAAVLAYLRMKHKDPYKGYILCAISRTVVHNILVGSVSFATPGPKAMHNASTAQEVTIITPNATNFQFRRWNDPSPMPPSPIPDTAPPPPEDSDSEGEDSGTESDATERDREHDRERNGARRRHSGSDDERTGNGNGAVARRPSNSTPVISFAPLPKQSMRVALILDRFSMSCPIIYISNDSLISTTHAMGRSFFDFVAKKDEELVRSWIDVIKSWGVNERGQPSDGGFGFGKFKCCTQGRDSSIRSPEPAASRHRQGTRDRDRLHLASPLSGRSAAASNPTAPARQRARTRGGSDPDGETVVVDSIFSAHSDGLMVILRRAT
ncbi:hypothetical protein GLOTRDRAFT_118143 [Gloeophyllum trabeum ATCC 11539]|uniref:PAS domain-containing protein n=1 Tax=Gloeophyllum trabeum (strain ATCC 11539 / FP-39264 / Madison 617) TaxID=670483 RepID=S7PTL7_GLOTA|nr:uncharacterized protein GLOTRDRAFT_118143 [Gloeophyllum trabeum ATCC 11539]EPQ51116.1 hypothetical protein GLOTRDRAFT_118143 [Gloeophyllum trabeum ATCC 11539]